MKTVGAMLLGLALAGQAAADDAAVWAGAGPAARAALAKAEAAVAEQAYETAFVSLGKDDTDPYLVAKKTEIVTTYFAQSLMHRMFALKDLSAGETLDGLRAGKGTYSMYLFDPAAVIGALLAKGRTDAILYKALADYYYDVNLRYPDNWLKSPAELSELIVTNYRAAFARGLKTAIALGNCADHLSNQDKHQEARELYLQALALDPTLYNAPFNVALNSMRLGDWTQGLEYAKKAIAIYRDDPNYQMDAILLAADASYRLKRGPESLAFLDQALAISDEEYRVYQKTIPIAFAAGQPERANRAMDRLFAMAPDNPAATQMVVAGVKAESGKEVLEQFFIRSLRTYAQNPAAVGNLSYHWALELETSDKKRALEQANNAKAAFVRAKLYEGETKEAVDELVARLSMP